MSTQPGTTTTTADVKDLLVHAEWLRQLATRLVHEDADDVVQETWISALRAPPRTGAAAARPWLAEVMRNFARRRWGKRTVQRKVEASLAQLESPPAPPPDELLARAGLQRSLADLVLGLEEPYRAAVLLRYYEGRSAVEIGRALGVPAGTIRWRLSEGITRLRKRLDQQYGDRQRWRALLLPLCLPCPPQAANPAPLAAVSGKTALVLGAVAAAVLLGGLTLVLRGRDRGFDLAATRPPLRAKVLLNREGGASASASAIQGLVTGPDGQPVAGAVVTLARALDAGRPGRGNRAAGVARTDGGGRFEFADAWPGRYRLTATAAGATAALSPVFTLDAGKRQALTLRLGSGGQTLAGQVLDEGGGPIPGARVAATLGYPFSMVVSSQQPARIYETVADQQGRYGLTLPPREYTLSVSAGGYAPAETTVAVTRGVTRDVRLHPAARVFGTVINRASGRPVAGAAVLLAGADDQKGKSPDEIETDEEGRFGFDNVSAGVYQVMARHRASNLVGGGTTVMALPTQTTNDVVIALDAGVPLAGRVIDESGHGLTDVEIALMPVDTTPSSFGYARQLSGAGGAFRFGGMLPGRYHLMPRGGESERSRALVTVDRAGKDDIVLQMTRAAVDASVSGRVFDASGRPAGGVLLRNEIRSQRSNAVESADDGSYTLKGVGSEAATLIAWHPTHGIARVPLPVVRVGETATLDVHLRPGAALAGVVRFEDGAPAGGISVAATLQDGTVVYDSTTTGPDGRFSLRNLGAGLYTLNATRTRGPFNLFTSRQTPSLKLVSVADGEQKQDVELAVKRGGRSITGMVVTADGQPVVGVQVIAGSQEGSGPAWKPSAHHLEFLATTREGGTFVLEDLEDDVYTLWAVRPGWPDAELTGVRPGTSARVVMAPPAKVSGVVVDVEGRPVTDFSAVAVPLPGPTDTPAQRALKTKQVRRPATLVRDPGGAFTVEGLEAGAFDLKITTTAGGARQTVVLAPGESKTGLRLVVAAGSKATGRVVRLEDGAPLAGLAISARLPDRTVAAKSGADGTFQLTGLLSGEELRIDVRDEKNQLIPEIAEAKVTGEVIDLGTFKMMAGDPAQLRGERGVTGVRLQMKDGQPVVSAIAPGSPGARAGLLPGDAVKAVGGRAVDGLGLGALSYLLGRRPGETLTLLVQTGPGAPRPVTLVADKSPIQR